MVYLRPLDKTEYEQAMTLRVHCWTEELNGKGTNRLNVPDEVEELEEWLSGAEANQDQRIIIGAFEADELLGFTAGSFAETFDIPEHGFELNYLFVDEAHRGKGLSLLLLKELLRIFSANHCNQLVVYNHHFAPSNTFYHKLGGEVMKQLTQGKDTLLIDVFLFNTQELMTQLA